jgi:hypothetical protein
MPLGLLVSTLLTLQSGAQPAPAQPATSQPAATQPAPVQPAVVPPTVGQNLKPLSFHSQRFDYKWDTLLPVNIEVDGLKISTIFFNRRQVKTWPLKGADFGARAQVEVTNNSKTRRIPGFAVAVFDSENRLLGVANGGTKVGSVSPGDTETFDLNFTHVSERLPLGSYFYLTVELGE